MNSEHRPNHIAENTFQEYLDGELPPNKAARVEGHLSSCAQCRDVLVYWQQAFDRIGGLPEQDHPQDLTQKVLSRLHPDSNTGSTVVMLLAEAALGAGLAVLIWPYISSWLAGAFNDLSSSFLATRISLQEYVFDWLSSVKIFSQFQTSRITYNNLLPDSYLLPLALLAILMLLAGNGIILKQTHPDHQRRNK